jgi:hypothetical protein
MVNAQLEPGFLQSIRIQFDVPRPVLFRGCAAHEQQLIGGMAFEDQSQFLVEPGESGGWIACIEKGVESRVDGFYQSGHSTLFVPEEHSVANRRITGEDGGLGDCDRRGERADQSCSLLRDKLAQAR